jgi:hypothetical protein
MNSKPSPLISKDQHSGIDNDSPFKFGRNPESDAWFTAFLIENHLDYFTHPDQAASVEKIRFMVYCEENDRYYPCSDRMFDAIMQRDQSAFIQANYKKVLQRVLDLIDSQEIEDQKEKEYLRALVNIKFNHETADEMIIPSRLEKRLLSIFLNRTHILDPCMEEKTLRNQRACQALNSAAFKEAMDYVDLKSLENPPTGLNDIKRLVQWAELMRLFALAVENNLWEKEHPQEFTRQEFLNIFSRPTPHDKMEPLLDFLGIGSKKIGPGEFVPKKILWLADEAGQFIIDLAIIRYLANHGHKIIIAFKEGPLFTKADICDTQKDHILKEQLQGIHFINDPNLSKNALVNILRSDYHIIALSDGTREVLNLLHCTTSFIRVFKEVDGVISRGNEQKRRFFESHFQFTQDIFNLSKNEDGGLAVAFKPRHPKVIKFSHYDLEQKAQTIIAQMRAAKESGQTVIFYSGIIGSIPGRIDIAKKIMTLFIEHLKQQFAMTFIINPSQYYEHGMDADDLMYMWEIVQRSGLIDIWRFQTYEDIAEAFQIMQRKVPPEWVGKDATYSTGCTKEMHIAMDVQKHHPEMQIIGPSKEKFMRRGEYGVGTMYDRRLNDILHIA